MAVGAQHTDEIRHKPEGGFERGKFGDLAADVNIDPDNLDIL